MSYFAYLQPMELRAESQEGRVQSRLSTLSSRHPGAGWSPEMRHTDYRTLINRGRKAGLQTADLYNALAGRRPEAGDRNWRETDSNGFISAVDSHGQNIFQPADNR
jgi:hypothetical protein